MEQNITQALEAFKSKDYKKALEFFETALAENENPDANTLNNIGLCALHLGNYKKSEDAFLKSIEQNNGIEQVYLNLTDLYFRQKRIFEAIATLETATALIPDNIVLKHYLARLYIDDSRYEDALLLLSAILEISPKNYDAYWDLAQVYFNLGDYYSAISSYEMVLKHVDSNPIILFSAAQAYEANNEIDKAISNYLKAISMNEKFYPAYKKLGLLFLARDEIKDAIEYLEDYIKLDAPADDIEQVEKIIERLRNK